MFKQKTGKKKDKKKDKKVVPDQPPKVPPPVQPVQEKFIEQDEDDLVFTGEYKDDRPIVKGGTVEKLVVRLTFEKYADLRFTKAFMLTYRSFTTPLELLAMLKSRYMLEPQDGASDAEKEEFVTSIQRPVRLRVYNTLKHWIQKGFYDFMDDEQLATELQDFIKTVMGDTMSTLAKQLQKMYFKQASGEEQRREVMFSQQAPAPIIPQNVQGNLSLMDCHPEEIARQLTLIEYELYKKIKPWECLNQNWSKKDKESKAPNILAMIQRFNQVSNWCATEIVKTEGLKQRARTLQHIIEVAEYCKALNNFNAMMEIISGLQNSAVYRLKQTWAALPNKFSKSYTDMHAIMSREQNYKNFRAYLHNVDPPCIPYLGVYLTDLTFIEDGNPDNLPNGLINFVKRQKVSMVISEIQQYQNTPYCLEPVVFIRDYLSSVEVLDENTCYSLSLEREARPGTQKKTQRRDTASTPVVQPEANLPYGPMQTIEGYPFGQPDTEKHIIVAKDTTAACPPIKAATFVKLVERLTYDKHPDMDYLLAFLMTYRTFGDPNELMTLLEQRFNMPKPKSPTKQQMQKFKQKVMLPIHLRIFNVAKFWVDKYARDFVEVDGLSDRMLDFVEEAVKSNPILQKPADNIKRLLNKRETCLIEPEYQTIGDSCEEVSAPTASVVDFDPSQVAEILISLDQAIFKNIKGRECLSGVWEGEEAEVNCPNIHKMRKNFDVMKRWALTEILKAPDSKARGVVVAHLIRIAQYLCSLKSFNALVAIMHAMIYSKWLAPTWDWVPQELMTAYNQLHTLVKSPKRLREEEKSDDITAPTTPYLELYLRQLSGIHDMETDEAPGGLINFEKRKKLYDVHAGWTNAQTHLHQFDLAPAIIDYLTAVTVMEQEEIREAAAQLENEAPSERPTMDEMPKPEKLEVVAFQEDSGDGVSELETEGAEEIGQVQLKEIIYNILSEDPEQMKVIVEEARRELQQELLQDLQAYSESVHDAITIMNGQYGITSSAEVREAAKRIVERKFPNMSINEWVVKDVQGKVYGWQEEVYLFKANVDAQNKLLVHVAPHVDSSALGALLRMIELYKSTTNDNGYAVAVITPSVDDAANTLAQQRNIQIMAF